MFTFSFTSFSLSTFATSRTFEKCGQHRSGMFVQAFILLVINMRGGNQADQFGIINYYNQIC